MVFLSIGVNTLPIANAVTTQSSVWYLFNSLAAHLMKWFAPALLAPYAKVLVFGIMPVSLVIAKNAFLLPSLSNTLTYACNNRKLLVRLTAMVLLKSSRL